jgi:hypothetical protein
MDLQVRPLSKKWHNSMLDRDLTQGMIYQDGLDRDRVPGRTDLEIRPTVFLCS